MRIFWQWLYVRDPNLVRKKNPQQLISAEDWVQSEAHPHTEGTFTGTLVNVGDLRRNSGECQGAYPEYEVVGSPKFAKLRHASPKFA